MSLIEDGRSVGGRGVDPDWDHDRKPTAQHVLIQRIAYDGDGVVSEWTHTSNRLTPDEAIASRVKRFRESRKAFNLAGNVITYRIHEGDPVMAATVTLTYAGAA